MPLPQSFIPPSSIQISNNTADAILLTHDSGPVPLNLPPGGCTLLPATSKTFVVADPAIGWCYDYESLDTISKGNIGLPGLAPSLVGGEGYGLCSSAEMSHSTVVCANNFAELQSAIASGVTVLPNFAGWYQGPIDLRNLSDVMIAGQAAPGQGIGVHTIGQADSTIYIGGLNRGRIEHIRAVAGDGPDGNFDAVRGGNATGARNLLLKNNHFWCGRDQIAVFWYDSQDIVSYRNIWGPSCPESDLNGVAGRGPIVGDQATQTLWNQDLFAGVRQRQVLFQSGVHTMANCVMNGWEGNFVTEAQAGAQLNVLNNRYQPGPNSNINPFRYVLARSGSMVYLQGNCAEEYGFDPASDQSLLVFEDGGTEVASMLGPEPCVALLQHGTVAQNAYDNAGVRPANRDAKQADIIMRCQADTMTWDSAATTVPDLPTLSAGPSRVDCTRDDHTSAEFRQFCGMTDSDNALQIRDDQGVLLFEHFLNWLCEQP